MGKFKVGDRVKVERVMCGAPDECCGMTGRISRVNSVDYLVKFSHVIGGCEEWYFNDSELEHQTADNVNPPSHNGGLECGYYKVEVPDAHGEMVVVECKDIVHALKLDFAEGNVFKELFRTGNARNGNGKDGNTDERAYEKIYFFACDLFARTKALTKNTAV